MSALPHSDLGPQGLLIAEAARIMRDAVRDKTYQLFPLGQEAAAYLRVKRKRLTEQSYRDYEASLDKFARYYPDLRLEDFEPPAGAGRIEEFLDAQWGSAAPRTYNKNLSILRDFFKFQILRGRLHGDPTIAIERARKVDPYRTTFTPDQRRGIVAAQEDRRDRLCVRLLLDYGLRKGGLQAVQFKHFDHQRRRLTVFLKRSKIRELPIPDPNFWLDLERLILDVEAKPNHYLLPGRRGNQNGTTLVPERPLSGHGAHDWWYRCLERAGIVPEGTTSGEHMHKARHTAGQRVLDSTGNLKAVQKLLGHESIQTTADIYVDWDLDQLAATLADVLRQDEDSE
jgi:integrase/recombinase XerC